jgi:hypothetical protein
MVMTVCHTVDGTTNVEWPQLRMTATQQREENGCTARGDATHLVVQLQQRRPAVRRLAVRQVAALDVLVLVEVRR